MRRQIIGSAIFWFITAVTSYGNSKDPTVRYALSKKYTHGHQTTADYSDLQLFAKWYAIKTLVDHGVVEITHFEESCSDQFCSPALVAIQCLRNYDPINDDTVELHEYLLRTLHDDSEVEVMASEETIDKLIQKQVMGIEILERPCYECKQLASIYITREFESSVGQAEMRMIDQNRGLGDGWEWYLAEPVAHRGQHPPVIDRDVVEDTYLSGTTGQGSAQRNYHSHYLDQQTGMSSVSKSPSSRMPQSHGHIATSNRDKTSMHIENVKAIQSERQPTQSQWTGHSTQPAHVDTQWKSYYQPPSYPVPLDWSSDESVYMVEPDFDRKTTSGHRYNNVQAIESNHHIAQSERVMLPELPFAQTAQQSSYAPEEWIVHVSHSVDRIPTLHQHGHGPVAISQMSPPTHRPDPRAMPFPAHSSVRQTPVYAPMAPRMYPAGQAPSGHRACCFRRCPPPCQQPIRHCACRDF